MKHYFEPMVSGEDKVLSVTFNREETSTYRKVRAFRKKLLSTYLLFALCEDSIRQGNRW